MRTEIHHCLIFEIDGCGLEIAAGVQRCSSEIARCGLRKQPGALTN